MKRNTSKVLALCILSALCTLPVMGQLKNTTPASQKYQPKPVAALETNINKDKPAFMRAVYKGDIEKVKEILGKNALHLSLLRIKMNTTTNTLGTVNTYPVCIAAAKGYTSLTKYMLQVAPSLKNVNCENSYGNLWDAAVENGNGDTAIMLLNSDVDPQSLKRIFDTPPFVQVAMFIKNDTQLKKLISMLLNKGVHANDVFITHQGGREGDGFFHAANNNHTSFITTLRDELKKRGQQPVAELRVSYCPGSVSVNKDKQNLYDSPQAKLLRAYNVKTNVKAYVGNVGCE